MDASGTGQRPQQVPLNMEMSSDTNKFKRELKKFLLLGSFYSIEEFFGWTSLRNLYALHL